MVTDSAQRLVEMAEDEAEELADLLLEVRNALHSYELGYPPGRLYASKLRRRIDRGSRTGEWGAKP